MPNNNPKGKGGFKDNPSNINKDGRPHESWAASLREVGETVHVKSGKKYKDLVSASVWKQALEGNLMAVRVLMERMDGLPKQSVELSGNEDNPIRVDITATLKKVYGSKNTTATGKVLKNSS